MLVHVIMYLHLFIAYSFVQLMSYFAFFSIPSGQARTNQKCSNKKKKASQNMD